jgi:hypothetical protein
MRLWKVLAILVVLSLLAVGVWLAIHLVDWFSMPELDTSLLADAPCAAPCWQNITPGVTTEQEARSLLKGSPYVRKDSLDYHIAEWKVGGEYDWFSWHSRSMKYYNRLYIREGKVVLVQIHPDYTLTLGQVVDKFGPPERVYATLAGGGAALTVQVDYPAQGLRFTGQWPVSDRSRVAGGTALITEDLRIVDVYYFVPGSLEDLLRASVGTPWEVEEYLNRSQEWKGFGRVPLD